MEEMVLTIVLVGGGTLQTIFKFFWSLLFYSLFMLKAPKQE